MRTPPDAAIGTLSLAILTGWLLVAPSAPGYGQVLVWGDNSNGQTNVPDGLANVIALAAGDAHCLALKTDGMIVAWGGN